MEQSLPVSLLLSFSFITLLGLSIIPFTLSILPRFLQYSGFLKPLKPATAWPLIIRPLCDFHQGTNESQKMEWPSYNWTDSTRHTKITAKTDYFHVIITMVLLLWWCKDWCKHVRPGGFTIDKKCNTFYPFAVFRPNDKEVVHRITSRTESYRLH